MATYVVSDLHGYYDVYKEGLKKIDFSDKDILYVIGDAIDRGNDGIQILQEIMHRDNMDILIGNHEFMMLNAVNPEGNPKCDGSDAYLWLEANGGDKTFDKYRKLSLCDRKELLAWLNDRLLSKTIMVDTSNGKQKFTLTHSHYNSDYDGVKFRDVRYEEIWKIVWCSIYRQDTPCRSIYEKYADRLFITGHVPVQRIEGSIFAYKNRLPEPYHNNNLINIDGGLSYGHYGIANAAIFVRLEDMEYFVIPLDHTGYEQYSRI